MPPSPLCIPATSTNKTLQMIRRFVKWPGQFRNGLQGDGKLQTKLQTNRLQRGAIACHNGRVRGPKTYLQADRRRRAGMGYNAHAVG